MDIGSLSIILIVGLLLLISIGVPMGFASGFMGAVLVFLYIGEHALGILLSRYYSLVVTYSFLSVPLFIFMASLLERSNIARDLYDALNAWLRKTRGGVGVVTAIMATIMAAMSGIIGGEIVLLGLIALPQMLRLKYDQDMSIGIICASGSLGTMIPPSIVLIIFGLITETSIKALFTAAFLPGFMLASFFIIYIIVRTQLNPDQAPLPEPKPGDPQGAEKWALFGAFMSIIVGGFSAVLLLRVLFFTVTGQNVYVEGVDEIAYGTADYIPWFGAYTAISLILIFFAFGIERAKTGWEMGKGLVAPIVVIGVVLGSIYGGISGITEAAGMGVVAVLIISVFRGEANFDLVWDSLMRTLKSTGTIIWVTIGAAALAGAYTIAGGPQYVADLIVGLEVPTMAILLIMMIILLFMGAFMDWVGIVLLIIPVFLPIVQRLPIEEIGLIGELQPKYLAVWFGVLFCMNMQVSFLSPPFGPAAFYLKSVAPAHISLTDIFKGFLPFIGIQILALTVLLIWPPIIEILL